MIWIAVAASTLAAQCFPETPYIGLWDAHQEDFGGAIPKNIDKWIDRDDYPTTSRRAYMDGVVGIAFDITADGKAQNCRLTISSGHDSLDQLPCKLIARRARFEPFKDAGGMPQATKGKLKVIFWHGRERGE